jgi:hypothetical protein
MCVSIRRTASTSERSALVISGVSTRVPSRSRESRLSPTWATDSRREKARNPQVPLIVCRVRKMRARSSREEGSFSSATRSRSS